MSPQLLTARSTFKLTSSREFGIDRNFRQNMTKKHSTSVMDQTAFFPVYQQLLFHHLVFDLN